MENNNQNLEELLKLAKAHDRNAQQKIIEMYTPYIKRIVRYYSLFLSKEDFEDLYLEALIATLKAIDFYKENGHKFDDLLFISIRNRIFDVLRKKQNVYPLEEALDKTYDFETEVEAREEIEEFKKLLSDKELKVFELYLDGAKISDIATILHEPYKSVDNTLERIKKKARKFINTIQ